MRKFSIGSFLSVTTSDVTELKRRIAKLKELAGLEHVEIWWEVDCFDKEMMNLLKKELSGLRKVIHAPFMSIALANYRDVSRASVDVLQKVYDFGLDIGAEVFTMHDGKASIFQSPAETVTKFREALARIKTQFSLKLSLENLPQSDGGILNNIFDRVETFANLQNQLKPVEVACTFDPGHVIQNGEDWMRWLTDNLEKVAVIHLQDAKNNGSAHLRLGTGDLQAGNFIHMLVEQDYKGFLSVEVVGEAEIEASWKYLIKTLGE